MIDTTKQYTYQGKPVRIYADGSDTYYSAIHCAIQEPNGKWIVPYNNVFEYDLVEVWQPKEGELVWLWKDSFTYCLVGKYTKSLYGHSFRLSNGDIGSTYKHCTKFTGTLPEAFKGLLMTEEYLYTWIRSNMSYSVALINNLDEFFDSNVCIPKGENRHKDADILHELAEDITKEIEFEDDINRWKRFGGCSNYVFRIKPSVPVYEWQYALENGIGENIVGIKYFTDEEYKNWADDKDHCIKLPWTKMERK